MAVRERRARAGGRPPLVCIVRQTDVYELMIRREAEALVDAGFDVEVICMRHPERARRVTINGVRVTSVPTSRAKAGVVRYLLDYAQFFVLTAGLLAFRHLRRPYAAVQVNTMPDFLVFAAIVPKRLGSRVVAYMHEPSPELAATLYGTEGLVRRRLVWALERIEQSALRFADHAVTVTEQLKSRYVERGACAERISVVLNGVAPTTMIESASTAPVEAGRGFTVVCHGTIEDRYGQDTIIEAARLLHDTLPGLRVVLTGRGSGTEHMCSLIDDLGVADIVRFEGWVSLGRLNDLLRAADAGVVAQKSSPYSHLVQTNKMVDYWIHGVPVVASRLRAVADMYDDEVIEYFEPGDARSLADALLRLHNDPARRSELGRNGRLAEARNGWLTQRDTYLGIYEQLLGEPAPASARGSRITKAPLS